MDNSLEKALSEALSKALQSEQKVLRLEAVSGGCINNAFKLITSYNQYFAKVNHGVYLPVFRQEAAALEIIKAANEVKVPDVLAFGAGSSENKNYSFLILEYLELGNGKAPSQSLLGTQLARLHRHGSNAYGWEDDNWIGSIIQKNDWKENWAEFWQENRLKYQYELAMENGIDTNIQKNLLKLINRTPELLKNHQPKASLLHGDMWLGNSGFLELSGEPVIYDTASYYGDRETDLAMTELFGGYSGEFYRAYNAEWPLDKAYEKRKPFYNLYHILNHFNLFSGHYENQVKVMVDGLLAG